MPVAMPVLLQGLTTCLYPLSVIKTRQMALEGSQRGLKVGCVDGRATANVGVE